MIDCVYYNDEIRCYRDGRVERYWKQYLKIWKPVENTANCYEYNSIHINDKKIKRHRLIAFCFLGLENIVGSNEGNNIIDHIDRNPLNNAVNNLRITTNQGNSQNTKCKGYYWKKQKGKFHATITLNGKSKHLGYYITAEEAHQAYLEGKRKHHIL